MMLASIYLALSLNYLSPILDIKLILGLLVRLCRMMCYLYASIRYFFLHITQ